MDRWIINHFVSKCATPSPNLYMRPTLEPYLRTPQAGGDALFQNGPRPIPDERPAPCHKQIFASLDSKEAALKRLATWTARREGLHIVQRVALTDGALALQKHMQTQLPGFSLVLGNYSACHCERSEAIPWPRLLRRFAPRNDKGG